ncbi:MAG: hypothetical protein ACAI35_03320 [Candidatus Methylacidiphilales bacterium]|nr:hypothetical protein [Candidatus Methylacidiphilales bacterium]
MILLPEDGCQTLLDFATEAGDILRTSGLYRHGTVPVTINSKTGVVMEMTAQRLKSYLQMFAATCRLVPDEDGEPVPVVSTMSLECAQGTLESDAFILKLSEVEKVNPIRMPVIRQEGELELLPVGYDEESRVFTCDSGIEYDDLNTFQARLILYDFFRDFPFSDLQPDGMSCSKAVAVAGMLSHFAPMLLPDDARRFHFVFDTNSSGSGKTLLAQVAIIPIVGECRVQSLAASEDDMRRLLEREADKGASYVFFDGLRGNEQEGALDALLTSSMRGMSLYVTCNSLELSSEARRRSLVSELYVEQADAIALSASPRVMDTAFLRSAEVRRNVLSALWAMINAWNQAGRPVCSRQVPGYEAWSNVYGSIIEHAGLSCPLERVMENNDRDYADMRAVVSHLVEKAERTYSNARWTEVQLADVVDTALAIGALEKHIAGGEVVDIIGTIRFVLTHDSEVRLMALIAKKFGGRIFVLADDRRVRFGQKERRYGKKYALEILG